MIVTVDQPPNESFSKSYKFHKPSLDVLECVLRLIGLLLPSNKSASILQRIRCLPILTLAILAFLYELLNTVNNNAIQYHLAYGGNYRIAEAVNLAQYPLKTLTALVILVTFRLKSPVISGIMLDVEHYYSTAQQTERTTFKRMRMTRRITGLCLGATVLYLSVMVAFRIIRIGNYASAPGVWPLADFPGLKINLMEEQLINFFTRNLTEAARLICSGYLALMLFKFKMGLVRDCRQSLCLSKRGNPGVFVTPLHVQRAWDSRELALRLASEIHAELSSLLAFMLLTDVLSLNATFADFLFMDDYAVYLRNFASMSIYIASMTCLAGGLIALVEKDSKTLESLLKLQSCIAHGVTTGHPLKNSVPGTCSVGLTMRLDSRRKWKYLCVPEYLLTDVAGRHELLRLLSDFEENCFGLRMVAPRLPVFCHVRRRTITNVVVLLVSFTCFMLEQYNRADPESISTYDQGIDNSSTSLRNASLAAVFTDAEGVH
ncbi:hypothetical protein BV898_01403 [Hypsibius exemplaris]|uniref:Gustatory receptor n=1 Tax=Hypsibius exemplaris TaxID=2072580 RepID=A0A1W0XBD3_HYPEX|nr:hypothetical protein BV898_01403 [Hypsibius exemplaris]